MKTNILTTACKPLIVIAMLSMMASCVKETLCEEEHPHRSWVNFIYDWSNLTPHGMLVPDSMFILVDRVVNQQFSSLGYDTRTKSGCYLSGLPDFVGKAENHDIKDFYIPSGEYKFLTVNLSSENFNYVQLKDLMTHNLSARLANIEIEYKSHPQTSKLLQQPAEGWIDANKYTRIDGSQSGFILAESAPVAIDSTCISWWHANETKTVPFKPTTITQNIDIFFDIKKDIHNISFEIDSVFAVISGIPHKVNLGTGGLDISNTDKMIFKSKFVNTTQIPNEKSVEVKDTPSNTKVRCYKNVTVLGIVENELAEPDLYAGPGVMQLIIYNKVYDASVPEGFVTKKLVGMVNIHKSLQNAKLQMYDPELHLYHKTREHTDLYISIDVTLTRDQIIGTDNGGIVKWHEETIPEDFELY